MMMEKASRQKSEYYQDVLILRDNFLDLCAHIAAKFSLKVSEKTIASLLLESVCESFIVEKLKSEEANMDDVDKIWRNLHNYAVSLLLERLKNQLLKHGFLTTMIREMENPTGQYDVLVKLNEGRVQILNGNKNISLEVKTGLNVSLSQLEKYLWNGVTLILLRLTTGDIVVLRPEDWAIFLKSALIDRIKKAKRILTDTPVSVPGEDCKRCPLKGCQFNKRESKNRGITRPKDLSELLKLFRENAYRAIEEAVKVVIRELTEYIECERYSVTENTNDGEF
ncbi:MAG: hypothetical protein QXL77_06615 [Candidatus Bathyarchaeia archaeon]